MIHVSETMNYHPDELSTWSTVEFLIILVVFIEIIVKISQFSVTTVKSIGVSFHIWHKLAWPKKTSPFSVPPCIWNTKYELWNIGMFGKYLG